MPRVPAILDVPVSIRKADIAAYAKHHGETNDREAFGNPAKGLRFVTFVGSLDVASGEYRGVYRFDVGSFTDEPAADLNQLPGLKPTVENHDDGI